MANPPELIEVLDAPQAAGSAASVLARLAEREEQRAAAAAKRLEELQVTADPRESVDAFMEDFSSRRQQLDGALQAAAGSAGGGGGGGTAAALAGLAGQIAELEQVVADATYFLPAYDLRQATLALAALREQQEAAAAALRPRKKFSFNRKAAAAKPAAAGAPAAGQQEADGAAAVAGTVAGSTQQDAGSSGSSSRPQQPGDVPPVQPQEQQQGSWAAANGTARSDGTAISGLRGQVVVFPRDQAAGREFTLTDLEECTVYLLAPLAALFLHSLRGCRVYTGPVAGACFVEGMADSVLMLAARQVRIHTSHRTDFYLRVRSHPIIEHSQALHFAPYAPAYPGAAADLAEQGLETDNGMWQRVNDFGWLRATPSPHWGVLPESERRGAPAGPPVGLAAEPGSSSPAEDGST